MDKPASVLDLCMLIKESYRQTVATGVVVRKDVSIGNPLTQEQMAVAVAMDMSGKRPLTPANRLKLNTDLYQSIRKMVFQLSHRYAITCPDDVDDLAQDCMYRILSRLGKFNPSLGKFTTWSHWVCCNTLNKKYRIGQRSRKLIVDTGYLEKEEGDNAFENLPERPVEGPQTHECSGVMANEMVEAIRQLITNNPKQRKFLFEMFGNPDSPKFTMPSTLSVSEAAKAARMDYSRARTFFKNVVRPFFQEQFVGC